VEHPDIERTMLLGYPDKRYLDWEREEALKGGEEDGERTPDEEPADR